MNRLSVILFAVFVFFLIPVAFGSPMDSPYLFNININSSENVTFANHNDSQMEGNWIDLSGGTPITLPTLNFIYYGVNKSTSIINGKTVNITTSVDNNTNYSISYPYSSHSLYTNVTGSNVVNMSFYGSSYFADKGIDIYLVSSTPEGIWDIYSDAMDGNTTPSRDLLNESNKLLNYSLNETGDNSSISFGPQQPGDYVVLVLLNSSYLTNEDDLSVLSTTAVQILKYESVVTAPSKAETNSFVNVKINLTNASNLVNYTYGVVLVHKDAYEATLRFDFNGTRNQTDITIDGEYLIEKGELSGINMSSLNTTRLINIIETVIGPNNGVVDSDDVNSTNKSFSLTTNDLNTGDYYLLVGVFESNERPVAFNQSVINIYTPDGGGGGGGNRIPIVEPTTNESSVINQTESEDSIQLFDITFRLEDILIENSIQLSSITTFESFGNVPTPVDIVFRILDENGNEVYREKTNITVSTENVLRWNYENLEELPDGEYVAILETTYNINVSDEFRQNFTIYKETKNTWFRSLLWIGAIILALLVIIWKKKMDEDEIQQTVISK